MRLLRAGLRRAQIGLRLQELGTGLVDLLLGGRGRGFGGADGGAAGAGLGNGGVVELARNLLLIDEFLVAHEIGLGLHVVRFGLESWALAASNCCCAASIPAWASSTSACDAETWLDVLTEEPERRCSRSER